MEVLRGGHAALEIKSSLLNAKYTHKSPRTGVNNIYTPAPKDSVSKNPQQKQANKQKYIITFLKNTFS